VSCIDLPPGHQAVLAALAENRPLPEIVETELVVAELRQWGFVMPTTPTLTGTGWRHTTHLKRGLID